MNNAKFVHEFLSELGGTAAVAKVCGITNSAVSQWRNKGSQSARKLFEDEIPKDI